MARRNIIFNDEGFLTPERETRETSCTWNSLLLKPKLSPNVDKSQYKVRVHESLPTDKAPQQDLDWYADVSEKIRSRYETLTPQRPATRLYDVVDEDKYEADRAVDMDGYRPRFENYSPIKTQPLRKVNRRTLTQTDHYVDHLRIDSLRKSAQQISEWAQQLNSAMLSIKKSPYRSSRQSLSTAANEYYEY